MVGGALQVDKERVFAELAGEGAPLSPVTVAGWIGELGVPRRIEQTSEKRSLLGWTSFQEPSCGGKG
jgi:hypothetical protein